MTTSPSRPTPLPASPPTSVPAADSARGASGYVPVDRVSARAWEAATSVFEVTIPKDAIVDEPTTVRLTGGGLEPAAAGHLLVRAGAFSKAVVDRRLLRLGHLGREHRGRPRGRRRAHLRHRAGLGGRHRARRQPARPRRPRRLPQARHGDARRRRRPRQHVGRLRRHRRQRRDVRRLLRRRRPAHGAPPVRRPHRAAHAQQRRLQGRAAGPGRPHGLDRQRADPQGRRGHRHVRAERQPRAHRRRPRRLGAEPGDRDRRDRRRRPRVHHRTLRRPAPLLPA